MKKLEITFSLSKNIVEMLESRVPKRKRNTFIEEAIRGRFAMMEEEQFLRQLAMDNKACSEALDLIDAGLEYEDVLLKNDDLLSENELSEMEELV